ncbi:hypothetical protein J6590_058336 [Homalodisca vitripennis]|nr:hypothetical protein J6590_058336 [Homalodisca vitripennis]
MRNIPGIRFKHSYYDCMSGCDEAVLRHYHSCSSVSRSRQCRMSRGSVCGPIASARWHRQPVLAEMFIIPVQYCGEPRIQLERHRYQV